MDNKGQNTLVGLFVLGGLVCLGVLIVKFGEVGWWPSGYMVKATFGHDMPNIREGTEVSMSGVTIGRVREVTLDPGNNPIVTMEINEEHKVFKDSTAEVRAPLMGQPTIAITPPPVPAGELQELPRDGKSVLPGRVFGPLDNIIDPELMDTVKMTTEQIRSLAEALQPAAEAFTELVEQRTIEDVERAEKMGQTLPPNLYTTVNRLHNVLAHLETVVGDPANQQNLADTLANLKLASEDARAAVMNFVEFSKSVQTSAGKADALLDNINAKVDGTYAHIDAIGSKFTENLDKLSQLLDYANSAGHDLAKGKGSAGMLLRDPEFYESLLLTTKRLGEAAAELQVLLKKWQEKGILAR
jgi:phospholipid/cholesterol/gamma-HCH transport system substrate-binding protein